MKDRTLSKIDNLRQFQKFLDTYYRLTEKSIYGKGGDYHHAQEQSDYNLDQLLQEVPLRELYRLLKKPSQKNVDAALKSFNHVYTPVVELMGEFVKEGEETLIPQIMPLFKQIFHNTHIITRPFYDEINPGKTDWAGWGGFYYRICPEFTFNARVMTAFYAVGGVYEDIFKNRNKSRLLIGSRLKDKEGKKLAISKKLIRQSRGYLEMLPPRVTIDNLMKFRSLPVQQGIPEVSYNTNGGIAQDYCEELEKHKE